MFNVIFSVNFMMICFIKFTRFKLGYKILISIIFSYCSCQNMSEHNQDDGWDSKEFSQYKTNPDSSINIRLRAIQEARDILGVEHHSLEPDMAFGWRPKLPSCPLPLSYNNPYTDALLNHIPSDDRFKLIYLGPRPINSVQVNQQNQYQWRYRSRYNITIQAVREAVKRVGQNGKRMSIDQTSAQISFDSNFESANLDMAIRIKKNEYDLFLRSDTNTRGHTSWYYFKVCNKDLLGQVQFNICNFNKRKNLYSSGLKPYESLEGRDWKQENCYEVNYVERLCRYGFDKKTNQLQFKYYFKQRNQNVYFAYSIPYTYTRLQNFITEIVAKHKKQVHTTKLCQTLGGLEVPILTINHRDQQQNSQFLSNSDDVKKKKIALITGRIHPGQSHSSFLIEGIVKKLLSDDPQMVNLRKSFVFHIIPMLNPDGVVAGNFRTSFSGKDLNRQFNRLNKFIYPEITALHDFAVNLKKINRSNFQFYFDFHAHSSKKGLFCYGPEHPPGKTQFFKSRALAKLIQQKNSIFSYRKSIFTVSQHKKATGRAHMLWKLHIPMSFTFEVSSGLYETKQAKFKPLTINNLIQLGSSVMMGLHKYGQLQMKIPSLKVMAKVDTNIKKKKNHSLKQFRKSAGKKIREMNIKQIIQLRQRGNTHSLNEIKELSLQNIITQQNEESKQDKTDFMKMLKQIRKQAMQQKQKVIDNYEGGSDSQSQGQDLDQKELNRLHKIIENRHNDIKSYSKGSFQYRSVNKKVVFKRQSQSHEIKENNYQLQEQVLKKPIVSRYLQSLKMGSLPPKYKKIPMLEPIQKVPLTAKNIIFQF